MGRKLLYSSLWTCKIPVEVQPHNTATIPDSPELIIRQIPPIWAEGPGIGVGGYHRPVGRFDHIPKASIGDVGHIRVNMHFFHSTYETLPLLGQAPVRLLTVGAAEAVGPVPNGIQQPNTPGPGCFQVPLLAIQQIGPLNAQKSRYLSPAHRFIYLRARAAMGDAVPVFVYFMQKSVVQSPALGRHPICGSVFRIPIQGEKLAVPGKIPSSHQVDMSAVFPQAAAGSVICLLCFLVRPHFQGRIAAAGFLAAVNSVAVGVKIGYLQFASTSNAFFI